MSFSTVSLIRTYTDEKGFGDCMSELNFAMLCATTASGFSQNTSLAMIECCGVSI